MKLVAPKLPAQPPPFWPRFSDRIRSVAVTARIGRLLGIAFTICFLTGLLSHLQYHPLSWLPTPAIPAFGYRVTQGLHVCTGIISIPLLLAKLWSVYPRLFAWPPIGSLLENLERASIAVLLSSSLLELFTGFANVINWYPWPWSFKTVHYWLAFLIIGSLMLHISIKLPRIREGLSTKLSDDDYNGPGQLVQPNGLTRRGALITAGAGVGVVALTTWGQTLTPLRKLGLLAPRRPDHAPLGVPINRTADGTGATKKITSPDYRLQVKGPKPFELDVASIEALATHQRDLPIACVEGWSAGATWRGPKLYDLVLRAGGNADSVVRLTSVQDAKTDERHSEIKGEQMRQALLATHINGVRLPMDHGYPVRLIAPNRAGALNTKWLGLIEVL